MDPFYKDKLDQLIKLNHLTVSPEDYKEILKELKIIDKLSESLDSLLQNPEVIASVLVTYMSKADLRRLAVA